MAPTSKTTKKHAVTSKNAKKSGSTGSTGGRASKNASDPTGESLTKIGAADINNYATAIRWLLRHMDLERMRFMPKGGKTFQLDRMRRLLEAMGNPHEQLKCVQVAGTKGKGSTCAMLSSMLRSCGYTVGLYTSPHLVDMRERIAIDGQMISHADVVDIFKLIASKQKHFGDDQPTYFEILTAAALRYFADQAVDVAVLETGLGGRWDATTAVTPLVCGLTQISLDHTNVLGPDLPSIAREKAGIFKKNIAAISVVQEPGVAAVFDEVAQQVGTPLEYLGKQIDFSYRFEANRELGPHTRVSITTPTSRFEHLAVPLKGEHQAHNCGLALAMLDRLKAHHFQAHEEQVVQGLVQTQLAGRMEQVWAEPRVLIDGAHNAASITALIRSLGAHIAYDSLVLIFGCGQDKDILGMLKQIALGADKVIFTRARANPRAAEPEDLLTRFGEVSGKMAQTAESLEEALRLAGRAVSREDLILVTGSFYLAGEAKKYFADMDGKKNKK
ncbi:MAG: bifunctional folylpolyglutamate synthase/dihydrofolate synthase [Phycisphaeraceae bacterium]|nr:bifunctional folylpolyglutamate synthase/dihydrofolate synthase [Phycisphaeraceae bacterium]